MADIIRPAQFNRRHEGSPPREATGEIAVTIPLPPIPLTSHQSLTVGAYLEPWLADVVARSVRPKTAHSYGQIVRLHLLPELGAIPLAELRPAHVQALLNTKAASGLAPRTVAYIRNVLRQALGHAERSELVGRNVARLAVPPRIPRREVHPLTPDEARRFLTAIDVERLRALYVVALALGLRQGEILGLRWRDVDLDARSLRVRAALQRVDGVLALVEPKSATSRRTLPIPALVADALVAHRAQTESEGIAEIEALPGVTDLVFRTTLGTPLDAISVTRRFQRILRRAGLPHQRFHDLRHACASLLLAQGVPARVVMETLGHSQISLTLNTYSHVVPSLARVAAERMDEMLGGEG